MKRISRLCICVLLLACSQTSTGRLSDKPKLLKSAEKASLLDQTRESNRLYSRFILSHPRSPYVGDAYYQLGLQALEQGEYDRARRDLNEAFRRARREEAYVLAKMALARAWQEDSMIDNRERHSQALSIYEELWREHREVIPGDEILFHGGECALAMSLSDQASDWFRRLTREYPHSHHVHDVKTRGLTRFKQYGVQVGAFKDLSNANKLMKKLRESGFEPYVVHKNLYLVRVGKFKTYDSARKLASRLRALDYSGFLVP